MGGRGADRMEWGLTQQARVAEAAWEGSPVGGVVADSGSAGLSSLTALEGGLHPESRRQSKSSSRVFSLSRLLKYPYFLYISI